MGLIFDILSSINNPQQQGNVEQLSTLLNGVTQLAGSQGLNTEMTQSLLSNVGSLLRGVLKDKAGTLGTGELENLVGQASNDNIIGNLVGQLAGGSGIGNLLGQVFGGNAALESLFNEDSQQSMANTLAQRTGLSGSMVKSLLPALLPLVLGLLKMGSAKPGSAPTKNGVLTAFLDSDRDGDVDLGDAFKFGMRFLNP
jgi:hypothetical protein